KQARPRCAMRRRQEAEFWAGSHEQGYRVGSIGGHAGGTDSRSECTTHPNAKKYEIRSRLCPTAIRVEPGHDLLEVQLLLLTALLAIGPPVGSETPAWDEELIEEFARRVPMALDNARLYGDAQPVYSALRSRGIEARRLA